MLQQAKTQRQERKFLQENFQSVAAIEQLKI
jgi:hypothetical protein